MTNKKAVSASAADEAAWESAEEEVADDPFATDFFSQTGTITISAEEVSEADEIIEISSAPVEQKTVAALWSADLPFVSADEIRKTLILIDSAPQFSNKICEIISNTFGQILQQNDSDLSCEILSSAEANRSEELTKAEGEQAILVRFSIEPSRTDAVLVMDVAFGVILIAKALGGAASALIERRRLSGTELAVLEFFALNCLQQINDFAGDPLFRLRTVSQSVNQSADQRCLLYNVRLRIGGGSGIVQLLLPFDFLESFRTNSSLPKRQKKDKIIVFSSLLNRFKVSVVLGATTIEAGDLAVLERDDIVLIERPAVRFDAGDLSGTVQIRIGDEPEGILFGELGGENLQFTLGQISQKTKNYQPTRLRMPDEQIETTTENSLETLYSEDDGSGLALEKIVVNLTVELASRRLTIDELAQLRVGQTLELGTKPTDPVELVTDGRTVAVGELVNVEGNLGVRLTRVLL